MQNAAALITEAVSAYLPLGFKGLNEVYVDLYTPISELLIDLSNSGPSS
jgi:hypothetical protein